MARHCFCYLGITEFGDNISEGRMTDKKGKRIGELLDILFNAELGEYLFIFLLLFL